MRNRLWVAALAAPVGLALYACVQMGVIQFYRGEDVILTRALSPGEKLVLGRTDLGVVAETPIAPGEVSFHLDAYAPAVNIQPVKGGAPIRLRRYVEAHLFARDPQEVFDTLSGLGRDHAEWHRLTWLRETSTPSYASTPPWLLPDDAVVPVPFRPHYAPLATWMKPVMPRAFWHLPDHTARGGPGNDPAGLASVKAVRVLPVGLCSREVQIQEIVNTIGDGLIGSFIDGVCNDETVQDLLYSQVHHFDMVSYLSRPRRDRSLTGDDDAGGGLLMHGRVSIQPKEFIGPASLVSCTVSFTYDYRFYLYEGRLAIAHTRHQFDPVPNFELCTGISTLGIDSVAPRLVKGLEQTIEEDFWKGSANRQVFSRDARSRNWSCDPQASPENLCMDAKRELELGIRQGADILGLSHGHPGAATDRMIAAARRPESWRCEPVRGDACRITRGRCDYIVHAKRINVTPGEVELVWFDQVDEYDNPAFALFVASLAPDTPGGPMNYNDYRELCGERQREVLAQSALGANPDNYYNTRFARYGFQGARCEKAPGPPRLPPPPPPAQPVVIPPPSCPCRSDAECKSGACDRATGLCRNVCTQGIHCSFPDRTCHPDLALCGGAECINDSMCHSYERCSLQLNRCMPRPPR